jgi:hypothetical protein
MEANSGGAWHVVGASVQGVSHVRAGLPCQDAHFWSEAPDGLLVIAVADGAGSAPLSEVGAATAVRTAVNEAHKRLSDGLLFCEHDDWLAMLRALFVQAREAVVREAALRGRPPADLATTLLLAVAAPNLIAAAQVGDGAVVARLADQNFVPVTRPQHTEYLNETTFLTSQDAIEGGQFVAWKADVTGLAVFSDGLQMLALKMPEGLPHPPFFVPILNFVSGTRDRARAEKMLKSFLQSPQIAQRADDDLTLVLAVRNGGTGATQ